jgi:hypothetical protein
MYLFTVVSCTAWNGHSLKEQTTIMRLMQRMLTVTYLWPCFFMCLHLAHNTAMLYNQHAAKYIWQTAQCMHLSVFLHYWAEVKVNKLSLRSVCPVLSTPGLIHNVLLVICYHPWVRMSRKMGSMEGRWGKRYVSHSLVHWPQNFSCWPVYGTGCPIAEAYYCKGCRLSCAYFRILCYAVM